MSSEIKQLAGSMETRLTSARPSRLVAVLKCGHTSRFFYHNYKKVKKTQC